MFLQYLLLCPCILMSWHLTGHHIFAPKVTLDLHSMAFCILGLCRSIGRECCLKPPLDDSYYATRQQAQSSLVLVECWWVGRRKAEKGAFTLKWSRIRLSIFLQIIDLLFHHCGLLVWEWAWARTSIEKETQTVCSRTWKERGSSSTTNAPTFYKIRQRSTLWLRLRFRCFF